MKKGQKIDFWKLNYFDVFCEGIYFINPHGFIILRN